MNLLFLSLLFTKRMSVNKCSLFRSIFVVVLVCSTWLLRAQEIDDQKEFSYDESSDIGPSNWGKINPEWVLCNSGRMQSPIDILNERVEIASYLGRLQRYHKPSYATLLDRGHDMMLRWDGAGYIRINGTIFELKQAHWHSPSEHSLDGKRFDLEIHLVHRSNDNRTAVIGIMYEIGLPDPFLSMIERDLYEMNGNKETEISIGVVDPRSINFRTKEYYRYMGSLTTPPCTENVTWTIVTKVGTVTREQIKLVRNTVGDESETNARPTQKLNGREVKLYRPRHRLGMTAEWGIRVPPSIFELFGWS